MLQKIKQKKILILLAVLLLSVAGVGTTHAFVAGKTGTLVNRFVNGLNPDGDLVLQKNIEHPFGDTYVIPKDLNFTFSVELGKEYAEKTVKTSQGEVTSDDKGVITVSVVPGGRTTIYDIDEKTKVNVTETEIRQGFAVDVESQTIEIKKHQDNLLTFTNTYTPKKADTSMLSVSGSKKLTGRDWQAGDRFTFELQVKEGENWTSLGTKTIQYELDGQGQPAVGFDSFDFTEQIQEYTFDNAGLYAFRVAEVEGTIGGILYDKTESQFDVLVGDANMDGFLEIQFVKTTTAENTVVEGTAVRITFENEYLPTGNAQARIEIQKHLEDLSGQDKTPAGYVFELYDEENQLAVSSEPTTASGETTISLIYGLEDVGQHFTYILKEAHAGQNINGLIYDNTEYQIQVDVIDNLDGTIAAKVYGANADAQEADDCYEAVFTNVYDPEDAKAELKGTKTLIGRKMKDSEFGFGIYQTDSSFEIKKDAKALEIVRNKDGKFAFTPLTFEEIGNYYYIIKEDTSKPLGGVTYDDVQYFVTVTVKDNGGILEAETQITDSHGEESAIHFENEYKAEPVSLTIEGRKELEGAELKDYSFDFLLYTADKEFHVPDLPFQTVQNTETGEIIFEDLVFSKAGTYRYLLREDGTKGEKGILYDETVYRMQVKVTDSGDGKLEIKDFEMTTEEGTVTEIVFRNKYEKEEEPVKPEDTQKPQKPEDSQQSAGGEGAKTGDSQPILFWSLICLLGILIIIFLVVYKRKKRR